MLQKEEVKAFASLGWGNRIATWLFYVSRLIPIFLLFFFVCVCLCLVILSWALCVSPGDVSLQKDEVNAFKGLGWGNRVATWLFYVS